MWWCINGYYSVEKCLASGRINLSFETTSATAWNESRINWSKKWALNKINQGPSHFRIEHVLIHSRRCAYEDGWPVFSPFVVAWWWYHVDLPALAGPVIKSCVWHDLTIRIVLLSTFYGLRLHRFQRLTWLIHVFQRRQHTCTPDNWLKQPMLFKCWRCLSAWLTYDRHHHDMDPIEDFAKEQNHVCDHVGMLSHN